MEVCWDVISDQDCIYTGSVLFLLLSINIMIELESSTFSIIVKPIMAILSTPAVFER